MLAARNRYWPRLSAISIHVATSATYLNTIYLHMTGAVTIETGGTAWAACVSGFRMMASQIHIIYDDGA